MRAFVDRIEGEIATLLLGDDGSIAVSVPLEWLPDGLREGMCLGVDFAIDQESTKKAHKDVQALLDSLGNEP